MVSQSLGQQYHKLRKWWASLALGSRLPNILRDGAFSTPASPEHPAMELEQRPVAAAHLEDLAKRPHAFHSGVAWGHTVNEEPAQHFGSVQIAFDLEPSHWHSCTTWPLLHGPFTDLRSRQLEVPGGAKRLLTAKNLCQARHWPWKAALACHAAVQNSRPQTSLRRLSRRPCTHTPPSWQHNSQPDGTFFMLTCNMDTC